MRINPDIEVWLEKDRVTASRWTPQWRESATTVVLTDTLKSMKETSCYLLFVKASAIPFLSRDDRFYRYIEVNFTFVLLDCDRYVGDIVHTLYCTICRAEKCQPLYRGYRFIDDRYIRVLLYYKDTPY